MRYREDRCTREHERSSTGNSEGEATARRIGAARPPRQRAAHFDSSAASLTELQSDFRPAFWAPENGAPSERVLFTLAVVRGLNIFDPAKLENVTETEMQTAPSTQWAESRLRNLVAILFACSSLYAFVVTRRGLG